MIVAERKPLSEIIAKVEGYNRLLIVGCNTCVAVCQAGGEKEVAMLAAALRLRFRDRQPAMEIIERSVERQCEEEFNQVLAEDIAHAEAVLSMACGVGVQFVAERYPETPVFPALNTVFCGADRDIGWFEESCRTCGECVLAETAGICPVTRCAKGLFNGPCGGTRLDGTCEVDKDTPCAWYEIHKRLQAQGRLENIIKIKPPRQWENQTRRSLVQEDYKQRYIS